MTRIVLKSKVGADGVLHVALGAAEANHDVKVTIEPLASTAEEQAEYVAWLDSIAGKWQGDFDRMPQGDFEQRDTF